MANRIEILQWRERGDDDDEVTVQVFADKDETAITSLVESEFNVEFRDESQEGDGSLAFNISQNDIEDGQVLQSHDGRKFRVSITEIPAPPPADPFIGKRFRTLVEDSEEDSELGEVIHPVGTEFKVLARVSGGDDAYEVGWLGFSALKSDPSKQVPSAGMWTIWMTDELKTEAVEVKE